MRIINSEPRETGGSALQLVSFLTHRYHGLIGSPYPLPNDDEELARLEVHHTVHKTLAGANVLVPLSERGAQILDVGTGSG